jgi:hypothetical protein
MDSRDAKEQREYERFHFRQDLLIDGTSMCSSMDICENGLYISVIQNFEKNSIINVTIPFKGEKLRFQAKVQYCHPGIGVGIMFVDLHDEQKVMIKELIASITNKAD